MKRALLLLTLVFFVVTQAMSQLCNPAAADCCEDAPVLCGFDDLNGYSCRNPPPPNTCGPSTLCPNGGVPNNMSWWAFVAGTNFVSLRITPSNCTTVPPSFVGVQAGIYTDCSFGSSVDCQGICQTGPFIIGGNTVPCQTYYVFIDGCAGSECDYTVEVLSGGNPPTLSGVTINGPTNPCLGQFAQYEATAIASGNCQADFVFTVDGVEVGNTTPLLYQFPAEGSYEVCVTAVIGDPTAPCDEAGPECLTVNVEKLPQEDLPKETLCWEEHMGGGTFFTECGVFVPTSGQYCCESTKPNGCIFDICKDFQLRPQPREGNAEITMCEYEIPFIAPNGQVISQSGYYPIYIRNGGPNNCDTTINYDVQFIKTSNQFLQTCVGGEIQIIAFPFLEPAGATADYYWVKKPSGEILGQGQTTITVQEPGEYCFIVTPEARGITCLPDEYCITIPDLRPPPPPISGDSLLCRGLNGSYWLTNGDLNYIAIEWSLSGGGRIISGEFTDSIRVDWSNFGGTTGLVCVRVKDDCGESEEICFEVTIQDAPSPDAGPDQQLCGDLQTNLSANPSVANGMWTGTGNIQDPTNPNTQVDGPSFGLYEFYWTEERSGCIITDTVLVEFSPNPDTLNRVYDCDLETNAHYYVSFEITQGTPPFTLISGGGSITQQGSQWIYNSDRIDNNTSYTIVIEDAKGCRITIDGQKECVCINGPGEMADNTLSLCDQDCATTTLLDAGLLDPNDTSEFILHTLDNMTIGTILGRNHTGEFCFDPNTMTYGTTYYVSYVIGNEDQVVPGQVNLLDLCLKVSLGQPVVWYETPNSDAGANNQICGLSINLDAIPSIGNGQWRQVAGSSPGTFGDQNAPSTNVTVPDYGTYVFEWHENNNGCVDSATVTINFNESPDFGLVERNCDYNDFTFNVRFEIIEGTPPYMLHPSSTHTGTFDNSSGTWIFESEDINSLENYLFIIVDANGCETARLEGTLNCDCGDTDPGEMCPDTLIVCVDQNIQAMQCVPPTLDPGELFAFILHDRDDANILNGIDTNQSGIFSFIPGKMNLGQVYYVSTVVAEDNGSGNPNYGDPCLRVTPGQPVIFQPYPIPDAGPDTAYCDFTGVLEALPSYGTGQWTWISGPSGATAMVEQPGSSTSLVNVSDYGTYTFEWTEDFYGCIRTDEVTLEFLGSPTNGFDTVVCDNVSENYQVSFDVTGGDQSSYEFIIIINGTDTIPGGTFTGGRFTTPNIPSGASYEIVIFDGNDCNRARVIGDNECDCITMVGPMTLDPINVCADDIATADYDELLQILDPNDTYEYILHDGNANNLGTILARGSSPSFSFIQGQMSYGTSYYITVVAGNANGNQVNFGDRCFQQSVGVEVIFHEYPTADIDDNNLTITCQDLELTLDGTGSVPTTGSLNYVWSTRNGSFVNAGPHNGSTVDVNAPGVYQLLVIDAQTGCSDSISVTVDRSADLPVAKIDEPEVLTCVKRQITLDGTGSDQGNEFEVVWQASNGGTIIGNNTGYTVNVEGTGVYTIIVRNTVTGCEIPATVTVIEDVAVPDIGIDQLGILDCVTDAIGLQYSGSSLGNKFSYSWSTQNGNIAGSASGTEITIDAEGTYTLEIRNTENGCINFDTIDVVEEGNTFISLDVDANPPRCHGEINGWINIAPNLIVGGIPPFMYSIDGGENFGGQDEFRNLGPGTYDIIVRDSRGCEIETTVVLDDPPPFEVEIGENVIVERGNFVTVDSLLRLRIPNRDEIEFIRWFKNDSLIGEGHWYVDGEEIGTQIVITPTEGATYEVIFRDKNGCEWRDLINILVKVTRLVKVPNVFTPNDDGTNDYLTVFSNDPDAKVLEMQIYDRWGELIYEFSAENFADGLPVNDRDNNMYWDGTFRGKKVNPAVFVWKVTIAYSTDNVIETVYGDATVIR